MGPLEIHTKRPEGSKNPSLFFSLQTAVPTQCSANPWLFAAVLGCKGGQPVLSAARLVGLHPHLLCHRQLPPPKLAWERVEEEHLGLFSWLLANTSPLTMWMGSRGWGKKGTGATIVPHHCGWISAGTNLRNSLTCILLLMDDAFAVLIWGCPTNCTNAKGRESYYWPGKCNNQLQSFGSGPILWGDWGRGEDCPWKHLWGVSFPSLDPSDVYL